jgi:hypothetical protein
MVNPQDIISTSVADPGELFAGTSRAPQRTAEPSWFPMGPSSRDDSVRGWSATLLSPLVPPSVKYAYKCHYTFSSIASKYAYAC